MLKLQISMERKILLRLLKDNPQTEKIFATHTRDYNPEEDGEKNLHTNQEEKGNNKTIEREKKKQRI